MAGLTRKDRRAEQRGRERTARAEGTEPAARAVAPPGLRFPPARIAILVFVTFVVFANTLTGAFVYDDVKQIVGNELIQKPGRLLEAMGKDVWAFKGEKAEAWSNYWRPGFVLFLGLEYRLFGLDSTVPWHLANVLLHLFVTLLGWRLLRVWCVSEGPAFASALLFAVHPVHVESVAWISGSPDLLLAAFLLGAWLVLLEGGGSPSWTRRGLSLALYAGALSCKEVSILFPGLVLLSRSLLLRDGGSRRVLRAAKDAAPYAVLAGIYLVARASVLGQVQIETPWRVGPVGLLLTAPSLVFFYLRQALFPVLIGPSYPHRAVTPQLAGLENLVAPLLVGALLVFGLWFFCKDKHLRLLGLGTFFLLLAPAMNVDAFVPEQTAHDRYLYLPLLGLLAVVTTILAALPALAPPRGRVCLGIAVSLLALQTVRYNTAWTSEDRLWAWAVRSDPTSSGNLAEHGRKLLEAGDTAGARAALDQAIALRPSVSAYLGRSDVALAQKRYADAAKDLELVKQQQPGNFLVYDRLAVAYQGGGDLAAAERVLREARERIAYRRAAYTDNLAVVLVLTQRPGEALTELEAVRETARGEIGSGAAAVFYHLGLLYETLSRVPEARASFREFLERSATYHDDETKRIREDATNRLAAMP